MALQRACGGSPVALWGVWWYSCSTKCLKARVTPCRSNPNSQKTQNQLCGSIANPNFALYSDNSWGILGLCSATGLRFLGEANGLAPLGHIPPRWHRGPGLPKRRAPTRRRVLRGNVVFVIKFHFRLFRLIVTRPFGYYTVCIICLLTRRLGLTLLTRRTKRLPLNSGTPNARR